MHRFRLISLTSNRVLWTPLRDGFVGKFEVYNPHVALMMAEGMLEMQGDQFMSAKPAVVAGEGEPDMSGVLIRGRKYGVIIEGAEFFSFGYS
jgi:hypothetical protein